MKTAALKISEAQILEQSFLVIESKILTVFKVSASQFFSFQNFRLCFKLNSEGTKRGTVDLGKIPDAKGVARRFTTEETLTDN